MLVLTRSLDSSAPNKATIIIGNDVEVTIVDVSGEQVRIGISAPRDVTVHRKEIWLARQEQAGTEGGG